MKKTKLLVFLVLPLLLTGCTFSLTGSSSTGGVFKSFDYAEHWEQKNFIGQNEKGKDVFISSVNTREIVFDQNDHALIYLATRDNGLFFTENGGEKWSQIFKTGFISSVAADPVNRGVVYFTSGNKIYKTIDQGENWRVMHYEPQTSIAILHIAIDPFNTNKLVITTSTGSILISQDGGESWTRSADLKNAVRKTIINSKDSNIIYAATTNKGIYKSTDAGQTWQSIAKNYKQIGKGVNNLRMVIEDTTVDDGIYLVSDYGIIRTIDGGETWQVLNLLSKEKEVKINAFAINPQNSDNIYYATANIIYRSFDGGQTWLSAKAPTPQPLIYMTVDPETPNVLYMGVNTAKQKPFFLI